MSDPIKKFVQQNREAFDYLEPPAEVLPRLKAQLPAVHRVRRGFFGRHQRATWAVAAALLAGVACTFVLINHHYTSPQPPVRDLAQQTTTEAPETELAPTEHPIEAPRQAPVEQPAAARETHRVAARKPMPRPLVARLADSSSASIRLAAILEIEQSGKMDDRLRSMLSETMNRDDNTNVRLAALDVLSRHLQDPQVAELLATALTSQDDPLVQLGIVKVAAQLKHEGIEEALFAVARNPYTFSAVKDEAYAILLHQEKL